jgi:hypothetical protein
MYEDPVSKKHILTVILNVIINSKLGQINFIKESH